MEQTKTKSKKTKNSILLVDDHPVVIEGIMKGFEKEPEFEITGVASDGSEAVRKVKELNPDIVILDIAMPDMNGIEAAHEIKQWNPKIHLVIYTMFSDRGYVASLFRLGVNGYILKGEPIQELVLAVKLIRDGGTYYTEEVRRLLRKYVDELALGGRSEVRTMQNGIKKLTVREKEVFLLLADGFTPKDAAKSLGISPKTVETHKYNLMEKLNVSSIAQLTKIAARKKLIEI